LKLAKAGKRSIWMISRLGGELERAMVSLLSGHFELLAPIG
jgi:hypothetical protein